MRTPSLTVETFLAALALLGASSGCSKSPAAKAAPEPAAAATNGESPTEVNAQPAAPAIAPLAAPGEPAASAAATSTASERAPVAAPSPQAAPARNPAKGGFADPVGATAVDAGRPQKQDAPGGPKASAACGAGGCTADMKKGSGN